MIVEIIFAGVVYTATFTGCYDGDTCRLRFDNAPPFLATTSLRFIGFDTPEIKGKCAKEKQLAKAARGMTLNFMQNHPSLEASGKRGSFNRLLVNAPELRDKLITAGLARPYEKRQSRQSWCNG